MPAWLQTSLLVVVIIGQLIGFFGLFLVFFPGLTIIWISQLAWAIANGFNRSHEPWQFALTIAVFVINTILMVAGTLMDNIFMAGGARKQGASWWGIGLSWVAMILASIWLTPLGGLAAALLVLFIVEWLRIKDHKKAFESMRSMGMGCGWAVIVRAGIALLMVVLWIVWVVLL